MTEIPEDPPRSAICHLAPGETRHDLAAPYKSGLHTNPTPFNPLFILPQLSPRPLAPCPPPPMARFALLLVCCLAAAITVRGADPEVCSSDDWDIIALPPVRDTDEAVASNQLARFVANTIRLKPDCKVGTCICKRKEAGLGPLGPLMMMASPLMEG